jgi:predicted lipoprotein with Yx(FWY)xxD motif
MTTRVTHAVAARPRRSAAVLLAAVAAVAALAVASMALAKTFTLKVVSGVHVDNAKFSSVAVKAVNTNEAVAVGPSGYPVYTFQGETTHHLICKKTNSKTTNCWAFWPPVSPSSSGVTKASGIKGKLGTFHNHGTLQLTLNGQPLYYFTPDIQSHNKHQANGDELMTFGSIWHVVTASDPPASSPMSGTSTSGTSTTSTTPYSWG